MGKDALPFVKHYPVDEEADPSVRAMSAAEFGAYRHLCNVAWAQTPPCSIPDDDETLARWSTLGGDEWSRAKRRVLASWDLRTDGRWYHPQLVRLWQEARQIGNIRRENGAKGGRPKKQNESKPKANDNHLVSRVSEIQSIQSNADDDARSRVPDEGPPRTVFTVLCQNNYPPNWATRAARQFSHFTPDRVEEAVRYIDGKYPGKTLDHRCALLTTCLNEEWKIELVPDTKTEDAAREKRLAELRAKREAKEKARQAG